MTEQTPSTTGSPTGGQPQTPSPGGKRRGKFTILFIAIAAGLAGAFTSQAMSHGERFGFGSGAWHHGGFMGADADPAQIEDRVERAMGHFAVEMDTTPEQQEKLRAIVKDALTDLLPMRDTARAARRQVHDLLTQATVDRAGIERFRAEQMALWDAASRRIAKAMAEAAEVLTPEQRSKLGELLPAGGGFWHGRHRG